VWGKEGGKNSQTGIPVTGRKNEVGKGGETKGIGVGGGVREARGPEEQVLVSSQEGWKTPISKR